MDDNNQMYMVVSIEKNRCNPKYAWVSFVELQGKIFTKRWTYVFNNENIKYGTIGTFDKNRQFNGVQDYFDINQRYSVAQVMSVEQREFHFSPVYKYQVGLAEGDFDTSFEERPGQLATIGNKLLLHYEKFIMNLTTMENCWNLLNHYNVGKYDLHPSYCGLLANKHCPLSAVKDYKNRKGEIVMPVVVSEYYGDNVFRVFNPQTIRWRDMHIVNEGIIMPLPRPSDIVLLKPTDKDDVFALRNNLTMSAQLRDMQKKFGLDAHRAEIADMWKKQMERE